MYKNMIMIIACAVSTSAVSAEQLYTRGHAFACAQGCALALHPKSSDDPHDWKILRMALAMGWAGLVIDCGRAQASGKKVQQIVTRLGLTHAITAAVGFTLARAMRESEPIGKPLLTNQLNMIMRSLGGCLLLVKMLKKEKIPGLFRGIFNDKIMRVQSPE